MERLSGLDASFLYLETPTHHMHLALTLQFDPSSVPGGYSFEKMKGFIASRIPFAPIFAWPPFPIREASGNWPTWPATSPASSSTDRGRSGR
jgi:hypothetical protein